MVSYAWGVGGGTEILGGAFAPLCPTWIKRCTLRWRMTKSVHMKTLQYKEVIDHIANLIRNIVCYSFSKKLVSPVSSRRPSALRSSFFELKKTEQGSEPMEYVKVFPTIVKLNTPPYCNIEHYSALIILCSGTSLIWTPLRQKKVSRLVRCPDFRG